MTKEEFEIFSAHVEYLYKNEIISDKAIADVLLFPANVLPQLNDAYSAYYYFAQRK